MIGQEEGGGAESLGEEPRGINRRGRSYRRSMERLQREKLVAWRNRKLYRIIWMEVEQCSGRSASSRLVACFVN